MGEGLFSPLHILLIVGIALLLFGPSKLADLGKGLGEGIRNFKSAMKDGEEGKDKKSYPPFHTACSCSIWPTNRSGNPTTLK
jgi:sec-independent protein translocase protein TatA